MVSSNNDCGYCCFRPARWLFTLLSSWAHRTNRHLSLITLSFVFILIWSSILSSIMIIHSYRERESATNMIELFTMHKNVGQLAFAIGNEMCKYLFYFLFFKSRSRIFF